MADYFTHFSCLVDVGTPENAVQALVLAAAPVDENDDMRGESFVVSIEEPGSSRLWIRDDGSGDPERVIGFVRRCAAALGLTGRWGFQYANACSRPRLDAFGGGAHVLDLATGETVDWTSTDGWLATVLAGDDPDA